MVWQTQIYTALLWIHWRNEPSAVLFLGPFIANVRDASRHASTDHPVGICMRGACDFLEAVEYSLPAVLAPGKPAERGRQAPLGSHFHCSLPRNMIFTPCFVFPYCSVYINGGWIHQSHNGLISLSPGIVEVCCPPVA